MFATRSRRRIPPILYLYVVAVIAMSALALSRIDVVAGSSGTSHAEVTAGEGKRS
jgi:hypothetical protein